MNRKRIAFATFGFGIVLALALAIPASAAPDKQVLSSTIQASILVSPDSAAPGSRITVRGSDFFRSTPPVRFRWDTLDTPYLIGTAEADSAGSFTGTAVIPPNAAPGEHTIYAVDGINTASAKVTVVGSPKKGLYIYNADDTAALRFQTLMAGRGMMAIDLFSLDRLSGVDFSNYGLIIVDDNTGAWDSPDLAPDILRLVRSQKPVLALGQGGFELLSRLNLQNGKLGQVTTEGSGITVPDLTNPIFQSPYPFSSDSIQLYQSASKLTGMEILNPVHHVVPLGDSAQNISPLATEERRFYLWGFSADPAMLTDAGQQVLINVIWNQIQFNPFVDTLILVDYERMEQIGYSAADVANLEGRVNALAALPKAQSHMEAVVQDLGTLGKITVHNARANWIFEGVGLPPGITSVGYTNAYVNAIDQYIEQLKQSDYPNLEYVIFVGSHEVIPMKARNTDDMASHPEKDWAAGLPAGVLSYNYFKSLYQDPGATTLGHYLTDTIYSDLSYVNNGNGAEDELIPELGVGRLVETPVQISALIDNYIAGTGHIAAGQRASIASNDYLDGGTAAANILGSATDTSLILNAFNSTLVPGVINAHNAFVYIAGHGNYNYIAPGFVAGADAAAGDTEELTMLPNSVVVTSGCHNGVNFGNMRYHDYTGNTDYGEFPERMAELGVGVYLGATGYTWISDTNASSDPSGIGWNEKLAVNFIKHLLKDGSAATPGKALKASVNEYMSANPGWNETRRVLAIATLYGFPTYRPPQYVISQNAQVVYGYSLFLKANLAANTVQSAVTALTQDITLDITNWSIDPDGIVQIPGADYSNSGDVPILPVVAASQLFPPGTQVSDIVWDEAASLSQTVTNDVPLAQKSVNGEIYPNTFSSTVFYPESVLAASQTSSMGDGGVNLTLSISPVQYDQDDHQTKIWTKLVFHVTYAVDPVSADVDSDADGLPDYWETAYGMSPSSEAGEDGPDGDLDGDGLTNQQELTFGTDPSNPDSDGDGRSDGEEAADGTDPLNPGERYFNMYLPSVKK